MNILFNKLLFSRLLLLLFLFVLFLNNSLAICFSCHLLVLIWAVSLMISTIGFLFIILLITFVNHNIFRLLVFQLINQFVSIINIFLLLLFSCYLHELHPLKTQFLFILIAFLLAWLLFHSSKFSLKFSNSLLSIVFIIILLFNVS